MANSPQARKRARQNDKRRISNNDKRAAMRTAIKKVRSAIANNDASTASEMFKHAQPMIDKMAKIGVIAANTASRYKSRLNHAIKTLNT